MKGIFIINSVKFNLKSGNEIFDHGIVVFTDMGIFVFFKMKISTKACLFPVLNGHTLAVINNLVGNGDPDICTLSDF